MRAAHLIMITIANPIYDVVFKYLLEDERVAKILLSALLQKEVVDVQTRKHEYSNGSRDKISMFRIDFSANVRQDDGSLKLVLIELQKTWLETEVLRFRQYLGTQYMDAENMLRENDAVNYGIPMIAVYLLGHKLGDIEEPVIYVRHKAFDYDGNEVKKGMPDPFVESLIHDSIIVQIPLLRGQVNNRLEKVLSVFDQSNKDGFNHQVLKIDETKYECDEDMDRIIRRLLSAASDAKLRQDMNVEDEYYSAIENRDTAIMMRDKKIAEQDAQLAEQDAQLAEQNAQLAQRDAQLAQQDAQLAQQDAQLAAKDKALLEAARTMKMQGVSISTIAEITSLPMDIIEKM